MKKIGSIFKILENEKIPSAMFWDEILKTRIALKLVKLSDERILKEENEYKRFLKTTNAMGLAQTDTDRVIFNKIYELCKDFSLIELLETLNKKYYKRYDLMNVNFLNSDLPAKKSVILINSIEHLKFLEEFILKNKNNNINLQVNDIYSKIILDLLFHELKNIKIIFDDRLKCDIVICAENVENYLNTYKDYLLTVFSAKFLSHKESEIIRKKIIDEHHLNEINIYENKNVFYKFKISHNKTNKIIIKLYSANSEEIIFSKNKKEIINNYRFNFIFFDFNFPTEKIGKIADIKRGISLTNLSEGEIGFINLSDLDNLYINLENTRKIDIQNKFFEKYALKNGDILLSARGTKIKASIFNGNSPAVFSSNLILIRIKSEKILPEYIAAIFTSNFGKKLLNKIQRGNNIINLNPEDIKNLEIPVADIKKQEITVQRYAKINQKIIEVRNEIQKMSEEINKMLVRQ